MSEVAELKPDVIIVAADTNPIDSGSAEVSDPVLTEQVRSNLDDAVTALTATGGRLVMIGDTPGLAGWPGNCLAQHDATLLGCAVELDKPWADSMALTRGIARAHHGDFIDPTPWFCADRLCPAVVGSMVTYRDPGHITSVYSQHLSGVLEDALALSPAR